MFLLHAWLPGLRIKRLTGRLVLTAGTLLLVMMFTVRGLFMVMQADWQSNYRVPDQVQAWTYMAAMAVILLNAMGFVLMQMEQACGTPARPGHPRRPDGRLQPAGASTMPWSVMAPARRGTIRQWLCS